MTHATNHKEAEIACNANKAYAKAYLEDVVENQGKLFEMIAEDYLQADTADFIEAYMKSKTRKAIDESQAYVMTMTARELWDYFQKTEDYRLKFGNALRGFMPDWIGEFYAYYQWYWNLPSSKVIRQVPLDFLCKAYFGLHDLDLELAVRKVGLSF